MIELTGAICDLTSAGKSDWMVANRSWTVCRAVRMSVFQWNSMLATDRPNPD